ncbi:DUF262 domain-containing protein [Blastococcus sp. SYSU DS0973]
MTANQGVSDGPDSQLSTFVYGMGHLISDRLLAIPDYQRSYSWKEDEVAELWDDLQKAIHLGAREYFLGSVVTTTTGSRRQQVIDGQQRLATVSLFYAAMRDIFKSRSDERAGEVERDFLGKKNMSTRELEPRLTLNAEDNDVFQRLIGGQRAQAASAVNQESHRRLVAAYDSMRSRLEALIVGRSGEDWQVPLVQWHDYVLSNAKVIEVHVSNENRAFVIFETLNDRGLNLSTADLLKGHIFGTSASRIEEAKVAWSQTMAPFTGQKDVTEADTFLRHYWASTQGVARVKALFSEMRATVADEQGAVDLAKDLAKSAPLWSGMFDRDAEYWKPYSEKAKAALETLRRLNVEQCRPLLLAAMRALPDTEVTKLLSLLVSWSVRWFVVGGGSAGVTERLYAESAREVSTGSLATAQAIAEKFSTKVPTDRDFKTVFATHTVRRGWLARYYLIALEKTASGESQPEFVPNADSSEVNLEHVLPRNAVPTDWPAFTPDELSDMKLLMGNQVLLRVSDNTSLGNGPFSEKRRVLAGSSLALTREVGELDDWTPQAVWDRQERLAELAVKTWRRTTED